MKNFYTWINSLNYFFWTKVVNATSLEVSSLSAFRIIVGVFLLATYNPVFNWIAEAPQALFNPPVLSFSNLFEGFPDKSFFLMLDCIGILSLVLITIGVKARISTVIYLLVSILGLNFQYSFGKIDHQIMIYAMLFCMTFSGWGRSLAVIPDKQKSWDDPAKSLSLLSILLSFAMFTAGFQKALHWIDFDLSTSGFMSWFYNGFYSLDRQFLLAPLVNYFPPLLLEFLDYSAVLFELSPIFFLLHSRKAWRLWLLIACVFHFANALFLNIPFTLHSMVYLAFIDFTWLNTQVRNLSGKLSFKLTGAGLILLLLIFRTFLIFNNNIIESEPFEGISFYELKVWFSLLVFAITILIISKSILQDYSATGGSKNKVIVKPVAKALP